MRERSINVWLPFACPQLGTRPATQGCALTGNRTGNPLLHRIALNPLSYTSQGLRFSVVFNLWHFNYDVSWCRPLYVHFVWDSVPPGLVCLFPSPNQGSFLIICSNKLSVLLFLFSCWLPYDSNVGTLKLSQRLLSLSQIFFGFCFSSHCFYQMFFSSLYSKIIDLILGNYLCCLPVNSSLFHLV